MALVESGMPFKKPDFLYDLGQILLSVVVSSAYPPIAVHLRFPSIYIVLYCIYLIIYVVVPL